MMKRIAKPIVHAVTGTRKFYYRHLEEVGKHETGRVLEIGSGKLVDGRDDYSARHLFPHCAEFRQTDANPEFGHEVLNLLDMDIVEEYDAVLCLNVLEHVFETETAVANLHRAVRPSGSLYVAVPFMFPLHDEPHDYWRFTEHALRRILGAFDQVDIDVRGSRQLPFGLFATAQK